MICWAQHERWPEVLHCTSTSKLHDSMSCKNKHETDPTDRQSRYQHFTSSAVLDKQNRLSVRSRFCIAGSFLASNIQRCIISEMSMSNKTKHTPTTRRAQITALDYCIKTNVTKCSFSHFLQHLARKWSGPSHTTPEATWGKKQHLTVLLLGSPAAFWR